VRDAVSLESHDPKKHLRSESNVNKSVASTSAEVRFAESYTDRRAALLFSDNSLDGVGSVPPAPLPLPSHTLHQRQKCHRPEINPFHRDPSAGIRRRGVRKR